MKPILRIGLVIAALMFASAVLAVVMRPTQKIADQGPKINLATMIPKQFADWKVDPSIAPVSVSPDVQKQLDEIYNQTLERTYINSKGRRVMLSIAYGGDQSGDKTQVHRPEYCYSGQGFQLSGVEEGQLSTSQGALPVRHMLATQGSRNEPITYWITIDDKVTLPGLGRKLIQLRYGMTGKVPDGMLVRVSSIEAESTSAYKLQEQFVSDMLDAVSEQDRIRLAGRFLQ